MFNQSSSSSHYRRCTQRQVIGQRDRQTGVVLVMFLIGAVAMLGVGGLALDMGYAYVNKTRMQTAVDAAALAAAREVGLLQITLPASATPAEIADQEANAIARGRAAALEAFAYNRFNVDLNGVAQTVADVDVQVSLHSDLSPALPCPSPCIGPFARVVVASTAGGAFWSNFLANVLPGIGDTFAVGAIAIAGPSPELDQACANLFPVLLCPEDRVTDHDDPIPTFDADGNPILDAGGNPVLAPNGILDCLEDPPSDFAGDGMTDPVTDGRSDVCDTTFDLAAVPADNSLYGYILNTPILLKIEPGAGPGMNDVVTDIGPGNFRLLALPGLTDPDIDGNGNVSGMSTGGAVVRHNFGGGQNRCITATGPDITTEPGYKSGPTLQGVNTRFGQYSAMMTLADYPADTCTNTMTYGEYGTVTSFPVPLPAGLPTCDAAMGPDVPDANAVRAPGRRIVPVPVGDCRGDLAGRDDVPILGVACMFLTAPVGMGGGGNIDAELLEFGCASNGGFGPPSGGGTPSPSFGAGLYKIILYKDPVSSDS